MKGITRSAQVRIGAKRTEARKEGLKRGTSEKRKERNPQPQKWVRRGCSAPSFQSFSPRFGFCVLLVLCVEKNGAWRGILSIPKILDILVPFAFYEDFSLRSK